ncbi:hypothetical protein JCM6882_002038 [Rhodosporidiobolus microsporus]
MPPSQRLSYPGAVAVVLLALFFSLTARPLRPLVLLLAVPFLAAAVVLVVLLGEVWVSRTIEMRMRAREGRGPSTGPSGGIRNGGGKARRGVVPPLYFTSPAAWSMTQTKASWEATGDGARRAFPGAPPFLTSAIDSLLSLILRDFVLKWYSNISDSPAFPHAVETTVRETLDTLSSRFSKVDWSDVLVGRILPLLTTHLETFRTAELSVHGRGAQLGSDEVDLFVASRYASETKGSKLHPAVDVAGTNSRPAEEAWLRNLVDSILPLVVPEREFDSQAVRIMVREIVSSAVLLPIFEMLGDPDFYNKIIDDKAGAAIRDQRMVDQFRAALDKQSPALIAPLVRPLVRPQPVAPAAPKRMEAVTVRTSARQFDSWMKGISAIVELVDAKRLRSDVAGQIRKAKSLTDGKNLDEEIDGVKVAEWIDFIERLYAAKRKLDRRIVKLGGVIGTSRASMVGGTDSFTPPLISLRLILLDSAAVSYFMEFLERRKHATRAQFWLLVEGLKDPLEEADAEQPSALGLSTAFHQTIASTAYDDVKMIWDAYLALDPFGSNPRHLSTIRSFVQNGSAVDAGVVRQVRNSLFSIQGDVLDLLQEEDFPAFARSDLYFKAVADLPSTAIPPLPSSPSPPPFEVISPRPTRPRARSNPQLSPIRTSPPVTRSPTPNPPSRPSSPAFPYHASLIRTETAPPQLTFHAAAPSSVRPRAQRSSSSDAWPRLDPPRKVSNGSLDSMSASLSSLPMAKRKSTGLSDSLDFLMSPAPDEKDRSPLFEAEQSAEEETTPPSDDDDYVQVQTIEAIQEALNSILATSDRAQPPQPSGAVRSATASLVSLSEPVSPTATFGRRISSDDRSRPPPPPRHPSLTGAATTRSSPSSLRNRLPSGGSTPSLVPSKPRSKAIFDEQDDSLDDIEVDAADTTDTFDPSSVRVAAPGDLHLPAEIDRLAESLDKLKGQEAVVAALIRKAELTGNASELKILVKSRDSLRREIRAATFQKDQYAAQATENQLTPERTRVTIPGTTVGQAGGGQSFQLYLVEVHQLNADGVFRSGWIVTRRYSEFMSLYQQLSAKFAPARYLEFPGRRLVGSFGKDFIEQRRVGLERYLQALIKIPVVCRSHELRAFLSQATIALPKTDPERKPTAPFFVPGQNLVRSIYRSFTSGIDDVLGTSTTSMMDQIIERLSQQAAEFAGLTGASVNDEDLVGQLLADQSSSSATAAAVTDADTRVGVEGLTYFTAPICDLFVTIFELKEKNNWLRRQAILIVLQQVLGGTIERKFRDSIKMLLAPPQLVAYINILQSSMWPGGEMKPKTPPRTAAEKAATKESANAKLAAFMPDVAANLIGRHNARQGARRLFATLQNRRLNKHLIYSVVDEVIAVLFPELKSKSARLDGARPLFLS